MTIHFLSGLRAAVCLSLIVGVCAPAMLQAADSIRVTHPWARATVTGQKVGGVYMQITSARAARLVGVTSPWAEAAEVHSMTMDGDAMRMRAVGALDLPPGIRVELAPGGYHIMLFDLKKPLLAGQKVPLTLLIKESGKRVQKIAVNAIVRPSDHHNGADGHR